MTSFQKRHFFALKKIYPQKNMKLSLYAQKWKSTKQDSQITLSCFHIFPHTYISYRKDCKTSSVRFLFWSRFYVNAKKYIFVGLHRVINVTLICRVRSTHANNSCTTVPAKQRHCDLCNSSQGRRSLFAKVLRKGNTHTLNSERFTMQKLVGVGGGGLKRFCFVLGIFRRNKF